MRLFSFHWMVNKYDKFIKNSVPMRLLSFHWMVNKYDKVIKNSVSMRLLSFHWMVKEYDKVIRTGKHSQGFLKKLTVTLNQSAW